MFDFLKALLYPVNASNNQIKRPTKNIVHQGMMQKKYAKNCDVNYIVDINKLPFCYTGKCADRYTADFYFIPSEFQAKAAQLLIPINAVLKDANKNYPSSIPLFQYHASHLNFFRQPDSNMFSMFRHHPLDYYGKSSKEPFSISLCFGKKDNSFFECYYNKFGSISRIRLICWRSNILYTFIAEPYMNRLQIISAYRQMGVEKKCIFDIKKELREKMRAEYEWICKRLPELAPKTLGGYTKMKNSKSKTYLEIRDAAHKLGISLD